MLLDHERQAVHGMLLESLVMGESLDSGRPVTLGKVYVGEVSVRNGMVWVRTALDERLLGAIDHAAVETHLDKLTS
jgi:hypothetical protein